VTTIELRRAGAGSRTGGRPFAGGFPTMRRLVDPGLPAPSVAIDGRSGLVTAAVDLACSPERAYRMLVTAETERWWGSPETYRMRDWNAELRVGGSWRVLVCFVGQEPVAASGEFLEFDAPERIVQTRRYEFDHPSLGRRDTTVSYLLERREGGSRLTVLHDGFRGLETAAAEHASGWERALTWLEAYARRLQTVEGVRP
jgi:uncharacterized protein YndB with AHSA1/START domain